MLLVRPLAILAALVLGSIAASMAFAAEGDTTTPPAAETADNDLAAQLAAVTGRAAAADYFLTYKFAEGEEIRTEVMHSVTVETSIQGNTQTAQSRSGSTKVWRITDIAENGEITFELTVEHIDMWQLVSGREAVSYDSRTGDPPPLDYEEAASTVGKTLASVTIDHHGRLIERERPDEAVGRERDAQLGFGELAVPLPENNVKVGDQWFTPLSYRVRLANGQFQQIQMRHRYQLEAVEGNVAVISMRTERLTPVDDPAVESQLMQQMQHGEIRFDMVAGRLISKELTLDEMVIGFQGANSRMKYVGVYTERALAAGEPPQTATPPSEPQQVEATPVTPPATADDDEPAEEVASLPEDALPEDDGSGSAPMGGSQTRPRRLFRR